jgi:protein-export membrane protein SecD/preprotein translocase SecF subunit
MSIRTRALIVAAVVAWSVWTMYPPQQTIPLGLDLNGGLHLVMRVKTDDVLSRQTQSAADQLRNRLSSEGVPFTSVDVTSPTELRVSGAADEARFRALSVELDAMFDRTASGAAQSFQMKPSIVQATRRDTVEQALRTIERRVNELGVAEPVVARYGDEDQILVQLPGVTHVDQAKQLIKSTAQLRLTLLENGPFPSREAALQAYGQQLPPDLEILPGPPSRDPASEPSFSVVQKTPAVSGTDVRDARQSTDEFSRPAVAFTLTAEAGQRFGAFTERHLNGTLATVLDNRVVSLAAIIGRIDDRGQIVGLDREAMLQQIITLKSGALPADLEYTAEHTVGASLGRASIRSGIAASAGGLALVGLFMLAYYRASGVNALVSIIVNLIILVALVAFIPVTMTLPGIAGLILTIGMGVDSNVLIFERLREELAKSRSARPAVAAAFNRVWITIVDTHVTSLVAAGFLFQFGTSPIRGFATTLTIGLLANVFTAVFVSRTLFELALRWRGHGIGDLGLRVAGVLRECAPIRFSQWGRQAILASALVIGAGMATIAFRGLPLGIDFAGGTLVVVEFATPAVTDDQVRAAVATMPGDEVVQRYGSASGRQFLIRLPLASDASDGNTLDAGARLVSGALTAAGLPPFAIVDRELVSAAIGGDLQRRGLSATLASVGAIASYIALRFRLSFAVGAIAATLHDVFVTVGCLAIAGYDLSLNVTAALLTIVGYSVNDTIVIFDRVRENARLMPSDSLADVVDVSVNQTLSRTVITAGTTSLAVAALYLFGGEALRGFAFTMLVGIISGTYSTVFIASAIATKLARRTPARSAVHARA